MERSLQEELEALRTENKKLLADMIGENRAQRRATNGKPWLACIVDAGGAIQCVVNSKGELEEMSKTFAVSGDADKWIIQRMVKDSKPGWQAILTHAHSNVREVVSRDQAFGKSVGHQHTTITHQAGGYKLAGSLSFPWKVHETRVEFSRG